ncbi:MAG: hypothetical protein ACYDA6_10530, partial [Solirubrobacteraceae bacterium]
MPDAVHPPASGASDAARPWRNSRIPRHWAILAGFIVVTGIGGSLGAAYAWRGSVRSQATHTFNATASGVSATLTALLQRDLDFLTTLRAVLTMNPGTSAGGFSRLYSGLDGRHRQVGSIGTSVVKVVPARDYASFQAQREREPAFRTLVGPSIAHVPPPAGASNCLLASGEEIAPLPPSYRLS